MRPELFAPIGLASETPKQFLLLDDRRIPNTPTLTDEIAAWQAERNKHHSKADWQCTTANACINLKRLYSAP